MEEQLTFEITGPASHSKCGDRTLLMLVCWQNLSKANPQSHLDCAMAIAERSRPVLNKRDQRGMTALMLAASAGKSRICEMLVKMGASIL
jgi:ankyrin repeat protein